MSLKSRPVSMHRPRAKEKSSNCKIRKRQGFECTPKRSTSKSLLTTKDYLKDEVKILKVWLNSGNIKDQVKAVEELLIILQQSKGKNQEAIVKYLLDADLAIFLSEAIESNNQFIELVFDGLVTLVTNKGWIKHHQIERVIESSLRMISTITSHKGDANLLSWILKLLVEIFEAAVHLGCSELLSRVVCIGTMCKQLKTVFSYLKYRHTYEMNAVFIANKLLHIMLDKSFFVYITNSTLLKSLLEAKEECFQILSELVNEENSNHENILTAVLSMSQLNLNHVKLCYFLQSNFNGTQRLSSADAHLMQSECTAALVQVAENIEHVIAPFMKNLNLNLAEDQNLRMWKQFLECLHALLNSPFSDETTKLANVLLISEYLELLAAIFRDSGEEYRNISTLSMKCLGDILVLVALEELNIEGHFQPPLKAFKVYLRKGLKLFPYNTKNWLGVLSEKGAPLCQQDAVIVFLYFLFKAKTRLNIAAISGPYVCKNIVLRTSAKQGACTSLPIVKALWLCLAIISRDSHNLLLEQATGAMVQLLSHQELPRVYSDHASVIWWIFSMDRIPRKLQEHVINIFLNEESSKRNDIVLKVLLNKGEQPAFCLLRIVQNENTSPAIVEKVFHIFYKAFSRRTKSKLCPILWKMLPYFLKSAIANETAGTTTNILELASQCRKASDIRLNKNDAFTLADLLITACVMKTPNPLPIVFYRAAIEVIHALLMYSAGRWTEDHTILLSFFNKRFVHLLLCAISNCNDQDLCAESLKLISYLMWIQNKLRLRINLAPFCIEVKFLVRCFMLFDLETSKATLQFTYMLIQPVEHSSIITLQQRGGEWIIHQPIRTLYYQVYNLYAKGTDISMLHKSWICLPELLSYAKTRNKDAGLHLVTVPWFLKFLILFCTTAEHFSKNWAVFLEELAQLTTKSNNTITTMQSKRALDTMVKKQARSHQRNSRKPITDEEKARLLVKDLVSRKKIDSSSLQMETNNVEM